MERIKEYKNENLHFKIEQVGSYICIMFYFVADYLPDTYEEGEWTIEVTNVEGEPCLNIPYIGVYYGMTMDNSHNPGQASKDFDKLYSMLVNYSKCNIIEDGLDNVIEWLKIDGGDYTLGYNTAEKTYILYSKSGSRMGYDEFLKRYGNKVIGMYGE